MNLYGEKKYIKMNSLMDKRFFICGCKKIFLENTFILRLFFEIK